MLNMKIKCNNPVCNKEVNTDKSHITRVDKESGCKLYFCSDECDISHKFLFNRQQKRYFHQMADVWKKSIEKSFREFYDFMPATFFDFMKPIEKIEYKPLIKEFEEKRWLYRPLHQFGTLAICFDDVVAICRKRKIDLGE